MTHKITIPDDYPMAISGTNAEERARGLGDVNIYTSKAETQEELIDRIKETEALINIRAYTHLNREILTCCPKLRLISIWGTGTDNVDPFQNQSWDDADRNLCDLTYSDSAHRQSARLGPHLLL